MPILRKPVWENKPTKTNEDGSISELTVDEWVAEHLPSELAEFSEAKNQVLAAEQLMIDAGKLTRGPDGYIWSDDATEEDRESIEIESFRVFCRRYNAAHNISLTFVDEYVDES